MSDRAHFLIDVAIAEHASRLDLSGCELRELPAPLFELMWLTHLSLRGNQLVVLPAAIGRLHNLTQLSLADNQLTELPAAIGQLTRLTHLNLKDNQLATLPFELGQLEQLQMLRLQDNPLPLPPDVLAKWDRPSQILDYYRQHHLVVDEDALLQGTSLHWLIAEQFTAEELRQLCADLAMDYGALAGADHAAKAHAFVDFHQQHDLMAEFTFLLRQLRPRAFA